MKRYDVEFRPRAYEQLDSLADYIAENSYPSRAEAYVGSIIGFCHRLGDYPHVGRARDDVSPGLRTVGFKGSATIAFRVLDGVVVIIGVFYRGRDYEAILAREPDE